MIKKRNLIARFINWWRHRRGIPVYTYGKFGYYLKEGGKRERKNRRARQGVSKTL